MVETIHPKKINYVGIDWGFREHEVCVVDEQGDPLERGTFAHSGQGLSELVDWLLAKVHHPSQLRVGIETPHGAVVESLLDREIEVYALNPKKLDRFRDRFSVAGAKDDRLDARVLACSLRTDMHAFQKVVLGSAQRIQLREWSRIAEELTEQRTSLGHQIRQQLHRYYPQMLQLSKDLLAPWRLDLWALLPTPEHAQRAKVSDVKQLLKQHRVRSVDAQQVLEKLRAPALGIAAGTTQAAVARIELYQAQARLIHQQWRQAHQQLTQCTKALSPSEESEPGQQKEQHDAELLQSLPGVGKIVLAVLLTEAHQPLAQGDYHALRTLAGVAPVTKATGGSNRTDKRNKNPTKKPRVLMRYACHHRLRNAVWHWARVACQKDPRWKQRYAELRQRGIKHPQALRTVGDSLLRVACSMIKNRTFYEPNRKTAHAAHAA